LLVYNDSLSQAFSSGGATTIGYYWWVAEGTTLLPCIYGTPFLFNPVINTDGLAGTFYLDYTIGDNGPNLIYDRSDDHLITVGMPDDVTVTNSNDNGPGSLRQAIDQVDFFGSIHFNLGANDTIFLQEELFVNKDINIEGPDDYPVVISGSHQNRVMIIDDSRCPQLSNVHIVHGNSDNGGGIYCGSNSTITIQSVTIAHNSAINGGGIYTGYGANIVLDSLNRCNIFLNNAANGLGADIYAGGIIPLEIILDTFSVLYPTDYYVHPVENANYNILHYKVGQVDADLYISPDGNNSNSGLTLDEPLKTIIHAYSILIADSLHQNTIHLMNGTYSSSTTNELFPVNVLDYVSIKGESKAGVILDAEGQSTVMTVDHNPLTNISDLTLTGGTTGLYCYTSNLALDSVIITNNSGSGILSRLSHLSLENVTITNNYTEDRGGGIYSLDTDHNLKDVVISNNTSGYTGGGIYFEDVNVILENVTISNNTGLFGGGISCHRTTFDFDSINRCNIYLNSARFGNDLELNSYADVILDTFSVLYPTEFHALGDIEFDILNGKITQVDTNLFVSPDGNDGNSGLTEYDPLKTIRFAMSKIMANSSERNTINLLDGIYSPSTNGEMMPVYVRSYYSLNGSSAIDVILDAEGQSGTMIIDSDAGTSIKNLTITGGNEGPYYSYIYAGLNTYGTPTIENVIVRDNLQGIYCSGSPQLKNVLIANNAYQGIYCMSSSPILTNVTIADNGADGIFCMNGSSVSARNSIISDNSGYSVNFLSYNSSNYFTASFSNINGYHSTSNGYFTNAIAGISEDPWFIGTGDHPFALAEGSPCIDAGKPDTSGYNLPLNDIMGNLRIWDGDGNGEAVIDMGAYEFGSMPVGVEQPQVTSHKLQVGVFPNPATNVVHLRYLIHDPSASIGRQRLADGTALGTGSRYLISDLYSIDGRKIRELIKQEMPAGEHEIEIDVSDLPEGVYFIRVRAGNESAVAKLVVVH